MTQPTGTARARKRRGAPLTRERVLRAAIDIADREGIEALTMRRLGAELGVEAMSLYKHVANKDDVLDAITDLAVAEIEVPPSGTPWKAAMRQRSLSAHQVLLAHPWATMLLTSRFNIGPGMTRYLNETLGRLLEGGFSISDALDAWNVLDSHLYGFTLQQLNLPFEVEETAQVSGEVLAQFSAEEHPHLVAVVSSIAETGRDEDLTVGLDLILDGLERRLAHR